jgi:TolB-like protein
MRMFTIKISEDIIEDLVRSKALKVEEFKLTSTGESSDFSSNEEWVKQKAICTKEYKKLKQIERDLEWE